MAWLMPPSAAYQDREPKAQRRVNATEGGVNNELSGVTA